MEGPRIPMVCYSTGTMNSLLDKLTSMKSRSNQTEELYKLVRDLKTDFMDKIAGRREKHRQVRVWMKQVRDLVFDIEDWIDLKPDTNMVDPSDTEDIEYFETEIKEARERFTWYDLLEQQPTHLDLAVEESTTVDPLLAEEKTCHGLFNDSRDAIENHLMDKQMRLKVVSVVGMEGLGKTTLAKEIFAKLQPQGHFDCQAFVSVGRRPIMSHILFDLYCQVNPPWLWPPMVGQIMQQRISNLREYLSGKRYFIILDGIWSTRAWKVINCGLPANNCGSRVLTTTCIADIGKFCTGHPNDVVYQMAALSEENSRILFLSRISPQEKEKLPYFEEDSGNMFDICGGMPLAIVVAAGLFSWKSEEMSESKMLGKSEEMAESKMLGKSEEIAESKMLRKSEKMAESRMLGKSVIASLKQYSTAEGLKMILEISYADLSLPVRSCFLYLSIFPENYTIKKDRLIRLWGAEGFIPVLDKKFLFEKKLDKKCSWVTGERYFNELISRGLIQPVFDYDDDQAVGCTVHSVILDFVRALSRDENFATRDAELSSGPFPCDTIRRFSLNRSNEDEAGTLSRSMVHLSSVRSLMIFGDAEGMFDHPLASDYKDDEEMPFSSVLEDTKNEDAEGIYARVTLLSFKLMRVLDLEDTKNLSNHHLKGIGGLVLLRYLGLRRTGIRLLPREIRYLEQLQTLDLRQNRVRPSIDMFPNKLVRLLGDTILYGQGMHKILKMHKILEMTELEEVSTVRARGKNAGNKVVDLLSKSKRLRMLGVELDISENNPTLSFFEEVVKSKLHSLSITCSLYNDDQVRFLLDSWNKATASAAVTFEPPRIELILSERYLRSLPRNMASLVSLTHLCIKILKVESEDLSILGGLPNVVHLDFTASSYTSGSGRLIIQKGAFPCLKVLLLNCRHIVKKGLEFKEGSVPQLRRLRIEFSAHQISGVDKFQVFCIKHLTCLTRISAIIDCEQATVSHVEDEVAHVREQVSRNPNNPALELSFYNQDKMIRDEG